jgi:beta-galactosidase
VILWSICNEEAIQGEPVGARIARTMIEQIRELDPSRPITAAVSGGILNDDCIATEIDVMGINYQLHTYDPFHAKHPTKPIVASETHCALSTRGEYATDSTQFVFASYDADKAFWGNTARETWRAISSRPFVAGMFAWTGFDYRGEPSPHGWPCVSTHWGILDTCGFEKDSFYLHKAWFTTEPFVHLLPHWNWEAGKQVRVVAYTNAEEVELYLNDERLDLKKVDPIEMVEWTVPYRAGVLKALAFRQGRLVAQTQVETTDAASSLSLEIHRSFDASVIPADGHFAIPITCFATDATGRRVPTASNLVSFSIEGPARIIGVGNGDPTCHEPDKATSRSLFNGLAQVIVQTTKNAGQCVIRATAGGLAQAALHFQTTPTTLRPSLPPAVVRYLISDWRMSPITADRTDPNQTIAASDMNTWQRIDPARGPQAFSTVPGFAVYRAAFTPPKILQPAGGRIRFHQIIGEAEIFLEGVSIARKPASQPGAIEMSFPARSSKMTLSVLVRADGSPAGIAGSVELLPSR